MLQAGWDSNDFGANPHCLKVFQLVKIVLFSIFLVTLIVEKCEHDVVASRVQVQQR